MPKRKTEVVETPAADAEDSSDESANAETEPKRGKDAPKKATGSRGRGRPPLSNEEKAKRNAQKATQNPRGRGRPKGSTKSKSPKKK